MTDLVLVTIVAERVLEGPLTELVTRLGGTGFTVTDARGKGSRNVGSHTFEGHNVRIETVVGEATATAILDAVADQYFAHYGVIAFQTPVQVVRGDKYTQ